MGLDKFISKKAKKKKSSAKSINLSPSSDSSSTHSPISPLLMNTDDSLLVNPKDNDVQALEYTPSFENLKLKNNNLKLEPDLNSELAKNNIFVKEFKNKSANELFDIILDLVHSSPNYSFNKNILTEIYLNQKGDVNIDILVKELEISSNEILVLLSEISRDFSHV